MIKARNLDTLINPVGLIKAPSIVNSINLVLRHNDICAIKIGVIGEILIENSILANWNPLPGNSGFR